MTFQELGIAPAILKALVKEEYTTPTPIQEQAIPPVLAGRDLFGCAQTGTGKTAAFSVPIIQRLSEANAGAAPQRRRPIRSLILTPTRELALQIAENITAYSQFTTLRNVAIVGGVSQKAQERALEQGTDILIATPGRLIDLMNQKLIDLQHIQILVLDEADRMLDMGFINDVKKIIAKMPSKRQTLFFSATMPPEIASLVQSILSNPVKVEITPVSSTVDRIQQKLYLVDKENKQSLLKVLLQDRSISSALVFTRTKHGADKVVRDLTKSGITAQAIHGNKSQNARQLALNNFKNGVTRVMVATDIAARGIDIEELSHVINYNLPNIPETYVHRIGRTGRAGMSGVAISFCEAEELPYRKDIEKLIGKAIPEVKEHPYPMLLAAAPPAKAGASSAGAGQQRSGGRPAGRQGSQAGQQDGSRSRSAGRGEQSAQTAQATRPAGRQAGQSAGRGNQQAGQQAGVRPNATTGFNAKPYAAAKPTDNSGNQPNRNPANPASARPGDKPSQPSAKPSSGASRQSANGRSSKPDSGPVNRIWPDKAKPSMNANR